MTALGVLVLIACGRYLRDVGRQYPFGRDGLNSPYDGVRIEPISRDEQRRRRHDNKSNLKVAVPVAVATVVETLLVSALLGK